MADIRLLALVFAIMVMAGTSLPWTMAAEHVVGDEKGWAQNFDYQAWAQGKQFYVGDKLVFKYTEGVHNVRKVNGTGFQQCTAPMDAESLTTGNDVVLLTKPGLKWYICSKEKHCELGNMKLVINVLPQVGSPASAPSGSGEAGSPSTTDPGSFGVKRADSGAMTSCFVVMLGVAMTMARAHI